MDFKAFYQEYQKLLASRPKESNTLLNSEESDYGDLIVNCKKVYYGFDTTQCEDSFYQYDAYKNKNCIDTSFTAESELCHQATDSHQCYNCTEILSCGQLQNCAYSYLCTNCQDCFGCVNLYQQRFCFFNTQLTEGEYKEKVAKYVATKTPQEIWAEVNKLRLSFPRSPRIESQNKKTDYGDYIYFNKDCYYIFDATRNVDCGYIYNSHRNKNSYDQTYCMENELCYELVDSIKSYNSAYAKGIEQCTNVLFGRDLINCMDCLGCADLKNEKYCILNKQYTPEEYEKEKQSILSTIDLTVLGKK